MNLTGSFTTGWRQVGACLVLMAAIAMVASAYSIVAVPLAEEFRPTRMVLMLAMTVLSLVTALLSPVLGSLMDRTSLRMLMLLGCVLLTMGYVALSFATSFNQVLAIFGLFMAPANVLMGPMIAAVLLSRWFVKRRGRALGIAIAGVGLGGFVFPLVIQGLLENFPWREAMRWLALILFAITVPAAALVVNRPSDRGLHPDGADAEPLVTPAQARAAAIPLKARTLFTDPTFWLFAAVFALVMSGMKGMVTNLAQIAGDEGITASQAAPLISIYSACGFFAKLGFAGIADRLNPRTLMFVSLAGFATGMACMILADMGYWVILGGVALIGLFGGMMTPMQGLMMPRIYGVHVVGKASGILNLVVLCALLSTPPIFGLISDQTGSYDAIFIAFVALAAAVMLAVPHIRLQPKVIDGDVLKPA